MPFTPAALDFLVENRLRNDKTWFEEHKKQYTDDVLAPFVSLTNSLAPTLAEIDSQLLCSPRVGGSISRIWRDSRFSLDKSLFRDNMWTMFVRQKNAGLPEFFFVVSPENWLYGCGYYSAGAASMESVRGLILADDEDFRAALAAYESQNTFRLEGEFYKKSRSPSAPEHLKNWLDRKSLCLICESTDFDLLYSDNLADIVAEGYKTLAPLYRFFLKAEARIPRQ